MSGQTMSVNGATRQPGRRARRWLQAAAFAALASLAACASTTDEAIKGGEAGGVAANVDEGSREYFQVAVGDRVYFATDRSDLTPEAQAVLRRQAEWLRRNPNVQVRIEGHADERGTREYNLALGARRAESVTNYLSSLGVDRRRLQPVSFGKERPVETCSRDVCWAKNRRSVTAPL
ncbi:MAG: peptidoglycan-associated lipoprotein Pal [Pseudomonadota bacterium]